MMLELLGMSGQWETAAAFDVAGFLPICLVLTA